ncbi:MAG: DUF1707 domain-containing protein [Dermatophilaceae bacterium]
MAEHSGMRIGDEERDEAVRALTAHFEAGRLDADAFEDRRGKALDAVTQGELVGLFADLPAKDASGQSLARPASLSTPVHSASTGAKVAKVAVSLSPFVAVALFFLTGSWLWFLLVPVLGVVYGVVYDSADG